MNSNWEQSNFFFANVILQLKVIYGLGSDDSQKCSVSVFYDHDN